MSDRRTITVNSTPGDATKAAQEVARAIQGSTGKIVTIGEEYTQPTGHKAGMLSVDLTIEDAPASGGPSATAAAPSAGVTIPPVNDGPPSEVRPSEQGAAEPEDLTAVGLASAENGDGPDLSLGSDSVEDDPEGLPTSNPSTRRQDKRRKAASR